MNKNIPYIKTKLLKKLRKHARKRYKFEEVYTRDKQKQTIPLYRVLDMSYDDDYYRIQKETTNREDAWNYYMSKYREIIFEKLDDYYKYCNKKPKSIHKKPQIELNKAIVKPTYEFIVRDDVSNKQKSNKIKI